MTQLIKTQSGSVYELDVAGKRIKRLQGVRPPTERQGYDWREYAQLGGPVVGLPLFIAWADESVGPAAAPGSSPGTLTSRVVSIEDLP